MSLIQNDDDEFLSLLNAQREILKRLKTDKSFMPSDGDGLTPTMKMGESRTSLPTISNKQGLFANDSDPFNLMIEPIMERRQEESLPRSESQSISGFGILPTRSNPSSTGFFNGKRKNQRQKITPIKRFQMDLTKSSSGVTRHNSLRGIFANALNFDPDSNATRAPTSLDFYHGKKSDNNAFVPKEDGYRRRNKHLDSNIDLATLRSEFVNFVVAMEKSMKSQQDIHDWDRKMGLKRSHSKTMRLSMRSRNRLRKVVVNV